MDTDDQNRKTQDEAVISGTDNSSEDTDDLVWEEEGDTGADKIKKLREKLKVCEKERMEYLAGWQRAKADYVNAKKGEEKSHSDFIRLANKEILLDLITVADSFDMAMANKEQWEKVEKNWRVGIEYIAGQLASVFERHNLKQINPLGEKFDHNQHASVGAIPAKDASEDGIITAVIQKGYLLHDIVIRSPKVEVAVWGE